MIPLWSAPDPLIKWRRIYSEVLLAAFTIGFSITFAAAQERAADGGSPSSFTLQGQLVRSISGRDITAADSELVGGRRVERLSDISEPSVTWYPAPSAKDVATAALLVLPGGGYRVLATDLEGSEVCAWLNAQGISALLLRYHVPTKLPHAAPLEDALAALALLSSHAAPWHVDTRHLGVIGFSAGAHLAGRLAATTAPGTLTAMLLIYPAYYEGAVPDTAAVPFLPSTPATFVLQAEDDPIGVSNSTSVFAQLRKLKVPVELHVYASGGHGFGLRPTADPVSHWPALAQAWLAGQGFAQDARASTKVPKR